MLFFVLLFQSLAFSHDVALATFSIAQEDDFLTLNIKLDKEDLEKIHKGDKQETVDLTKETNFIQQFVDENFYLLANEQKVNFDVDLISQNDYFYHIKLSSKKRLEEEIRHLQIKNTCFIETVEGHSNIVNLHINEKSRTFRMHQERKRIEVMY